MGNFCSLKEDNWKQVVTPMKDMILNYMRVASKKGQKSRSQQKEFHSLGAKSIACKRNEMEIERGRPVGDVEFYLITHSKKNGGMNDAARDVVDKCKAEIAQRTGNNNVDLNDNIELQTQVIRDIRGPEHPGRVRGEGMGPTPSMIFGRRSRVISDNVQRLEAQVAKLMQRDVEREADYKRLKNW